jgi:hypothetical protein
LEVDGAALAADAPASSITDSTHPKGRSQGLETLLDDPHAKLSDEAGGMDFGKLARPGETQGR